MGTLENSAIGNSVDEVVAFCIVKAVKKYEAHIREEKISTRFTLAYTKLIDECREELDQEKASIIAHIPLGYFEDKNIWDFYGVLKPTESFYFCPHKVNKLYKEMYNNLFLNLNDPHQILEKWLRVSLRRALYQYEELINKRSTTENPYSCPVTKGDFCTFLRTSLSSNLRPYYQENIDNWATFINRFCNPDNWEDPGKFRRVLKIEAFGSSLQIDNALVKNLIGDFKVYSSVKPITIPSLKQELEPDIAQLNLEISAFNSYTAQVAKLTENIASLNKSYEQQRDSQGSA